MIKHPSSIIAVACLLLSNVLPVLSNSNDETFSGAFFSGTAQTADGKAYLELLDQARRMLAPADPRAELMTPSGVLDATTNGITEGAQWAGNIWTQNTYGFGLTAAPFLTAAQRQQLRTSYSWWFDHRGDGGQMYGGLPDVPAGMLCDNGSPTGCNFMQCGPGRSAALTDRPLQGQRQSGKSKSKSKRAATMDAFKKRQSPLVGDTEALGHDWIIEGSLAGVLMKSELLLTQRNITGAREYLPIFKSLLDFLETRRVQDSSPLTPGAQGLFFAGNGANLLAPAFGGQPLPRGCLFNASCGQPGFGPCCKNRGFAYLTSLTVTSSGVYDRMQQLEAMAWGTDVRNCTRPNGDTDASVRTCSSLWRARRAANDVALKAVMVNMSSSSSSSSSSQYLLKALAADGEQFGVYAPREACNTTDTVCAPETRHGYFETAPNVDALALRVVDAATRKSIYSSIQAVGRGLNPCGFTLPNFPAYDDSTTSFGFGTWVSGGIWSTLEGRAILAHLDQRRFDLAAASMARLMYPYARLFKLDNPFAFQGCGPGMYSQDGSRGVDGGPLLDVDVFGQPAAFLRGLYGLFYGADALTLRPRLHPGITLIRSLAPVAWGGGQLFLTLQRGVGDDGMTQNGTESEMVTSVTINGTACVACISASGEDVVLPWDDGMGSGAATTVVVTLGSNSSNSSRSSSSSEAAGMSAAAAVMQWRQLQASRRQIPGVGVRGGPCDPSPDVEANVKNATAFRRRLESQGLEGRFEYVQAGDYLSAVQVATLRCTGRASGAIEAMPAEPAAWKTAGYKMTYNQTKTELYFAAAATRLFSGLAAAIGSYVGRGNIDHDEARVLAAFRGADEKRRPTAEDEPAAAADRRSALVVLLDQKIAVAEAELKMLKKARAEALLGAAQAQEENGW